MPDIEYFYSAHSVFAYLGAKTLKDIADAAGWRIVHKPMDLGPVVAAAYPGGFAERSPEHRAYYFGREIERWAEYRGAALKGGIPANHRNSVELANTMLIACAMQGGDVDRLAHAVMQAHWVDHADLADREILAGAAGSVGMDADALLQQAQTPTVMAAYKANTAEALDRSVFGSPTYVIDGDMFYGQDHLELVERAMRKPFARTWT